VKIRRDQPATGKRAGRTYTRQQRESMRARRAAENVITIPPPANPSRRRRCQRSLMAYLRTYHQATYALPFSADHLAMVTAIQAAIMAGTDLYIAADRGKGKSTIARHAVLWAVLSRHRHFVLLAAATGDDADRALINIRAELESNDLLAADYPEVCTAIRELEGSPQRAPSQTSTGWHQHEKRCNLRWSGRYIRLPDEWAGGPRRKTKLPPRFIATRGLDAAIRGLNYESTRPDLVVIDDAETRESVKSMQQTQDRDRIIRTDLAGLAGRRKKLTMIGLGTIMARGCLCDRYTDPQQEPAWHGQRYRYLVTPPAHPELWTEYMAIRRDPDRGPALALAHYRNYREEMDAGAVVSWPESYLPDSQLSALQAYYDLWSDRGLEYVACELQNAPEMIEEADMGRLTVAAVKARTNNLARGSVPVEVETVVAFIDVQRDALWWAAVGWSETCTGWVIDYGRWPPGRMGLQDQYPAMAPEAQIRAGLEALVPLLAAPRTREDGTELTPARIAIDSAWGQSTSTVYAYCRESAQRSILIPYRGEYVGPGKDFSRGPARGGRRGHGWRIGATPDGSRQIRLLTADSNRWKSFLRDRLMAPIGQQGALTVFGSHADAHTDLALHLTAETATIAQTDRGRYELWRMIPNRINHWLDCLAGCCALAAVSGVRLDDRSRIDPKWKAPEAGGTAQAQPAEPAPAAEPPAIPIRPPPVPVPGGFVRRPLAGGPRLPGTGGWVNAWR
jgi:hypothetical protein